jgi:hypothetical protein
LADYVGLEHAENAEALIIETDKNRTASVQTKIASHAKVFFGRSEAEQTALIEKAKTMLFVGVILGARGLTRQACPACKASARVIGDLINESSPFYDGADLAVSRTYRASELRCMACELALSSIEEIRIAGIEPRFQTYSTLDPRDYFKLEDEEPYMDM